MDTTRPTPVDAGFAEDRGIAAALVEVGGSRLADQEHLVIPVAEVAQRVPPGPWHGTTAGDLRVKRHGCPPAYQPALSAVIARVNELLQLDAVPHWIVADLVVGLHVRGVDDLRHVMGSAGLAEDVVFTEPAYEVVRQAHEACLRSLAVFVEHDDDLRDAAYGGRPEVAPAFPVADRYRAAHALAGTLLGEVDLPAELAGLSTPGRQTLFCDPKPANFLVPVAGTPQRWRTNGHRPVRVDFDLMYWSCPLSLQIILALFSHPLGFHRGGAVDERFDDLLAYARAAAARFAVARAELDTMLLYHLLRNFTSAAADPGSVVKARALAPVLGAAIERLAPAGMGARTRRSLAGWQVAHGA